MPKAAVWQTRRQAKNFREKKRKEKEAGEERQDDNHEDADAEDGDRDGDGDGGYQGDGPRAGDGAPAANRDEGMGVEVAGLEVEGVVGDGSVVGEGEAGVSSRGSRPADHVAGVAQGRTKRLTPCTLASTLTYNVCFTYPLSTLCLLFCLRVPVVFR